MRLGDFGGEQKSAVSVDFGCPLFSPGSTLFLFSFPLHSLHLLLSWDSSDPHLQFNSIYSHYFNINKIFIIKKNRMYILHSNIFLIQHERKRIIKKFKKLLF